MIRPALAADAAALAALHGAAFEDRWSAGAMRDLLAMPGAFALIAEAGEGPRGFVLARQAADEGEIVSVATHPAARQQGLGTDLLEAALGRLAAGGVQTVFLEVAVDNAAALALYAKFGFALAGRRKAYYERNTGVRVDALIMRRIGAAAAPHNGLEPQRMDGSL